MRQAHDTPLSAGGTRRGFHLLLSFVLVASLAIFTALYAALEPSWAPSLALTALTAAASVGSLHLHVANVNIDDIACDPRLMPVE